MLGKKFNEKAGVSVRIFDTANGGPAEGIHVKIFKRSPEGKEIGTE